MKLTMPDGREWIAIEKRGRRYYLGRQRVRGVRFAELTGLTAAGIRNRMIRWGIDFTTACNAPRATHANGNLQSPEMQAYLAMIRKWPDWPERKANGVDPEPEVVAPTAPSVIPVKQQQMLFEPRPRPQEVDVRVTVVGDQDANVTAMRAALERLCVMTASILEEFRILNAPPQSYVAPHIAETEDHTSNDMD